MRDERHPLFLVALQLMSGQKVTVCAAVAPPQRAEPATAVTAFPFRLFYCVVITAEASALFELFQEVSPPQQPLRVN